MIKLNRIISVAIMLAALAGGSISAEQLVILTTNDTHSQIDPDFDGRGGVLRRKVIFDSVRRAERYVLAIDAGDVVQGTPYFSLFGGAVEYPLIDSLGYDISVLGNHEFDNGIDSLAYRQRHMRATRLSTNYGLENTKLAGQYEPYIIKEYGGRRFGFIGINVNPEGMIDMANCRGLVYNDPIKVANETARYLKRQKGVDMVIMVSHIGYKTNKEDAPVDPEVVKAGTDIDLVIGGHSHTLIDPVNPPEGVDYLVPNKAGRLVPVTQTGSQGKNVGLIKIDLDDLSVDYSLIRVDSRWDDRVDYPALEAFLAPFQKPVHEMLGRTVAQSASACYSYGVEMQNWTADMAYELATSLSGQSIDLAIMNKGGIRQSLPKGDVSEGLICAMYPFNNYLTVIEISGEDLIASFQVMAHRGGDAVSNSVRVLYHSDGTVENATVWGRAVNRAKVYRVATLDYLAHGGDAMAPLKNGKVLFTDNVKFGDRVLDYVKKLGKNGVVINPTARPRMQLID